MTRLLGACKWPDVASCQPCEVEKREHIKDNPRDMPEMIHRIREALKSIHDGEISVSAYDTAWVALVKNIHGGDGPQFPSCIDWIIQNQLADGSWGDEKYFLAHDRIINTLACIIALKSWNVHEDKCMKGISFIHKYQRKLTEEDEDWMLSGFEIAFPVLLEMAKNLGLNMAFDEHTLEMIYAKRDRKLRRIPKDVLHTVATTSLLSIEGRKNLDWERLFKLQQIDGSFMSSPAPTVYALMETGDKKCFVFLDKIVHKFNGGVPFTYPVDIFERLWVVDRLERLGISRYFTSEIAEFLDYANSHWTSEGLPAMRESPLNDIDDTAMGFRLLRLHGYCVSPQVFKYFERGDEFVCYPGQSNQSVTTNYNLYRATEIAFPGEDILYRANTYSRAFLEERRASGKLNDKWVIAKDLPGEVGYALDFPWKASLPRIETRMYLEQYGGSDDVWLGKVLFRMPLISNDLFLEAAKADFRNFQRRCQLEWHGLKTWFHKTNLEMFGVSSDRALTAYFLAAANIFELNGATERLAWARTSVIAEAVSCHLQCNSYNHREKERLIHKLENHSRNEVARGQEDRTDALVCSLYEVINLAGDDNASYQLCEAWKQWLRSWTVNKESPESCDGSTALLLVQTLEIYSGRHKLNERNSFVPEYCHLERLTSSICSKLESGPVSKIVDVENIENRSDHEVDLEMLELAKCVLQSSTSINKVTRLAFISVVKSFYYVAHCSPETVDSHIYKVIFEDVF